MNPSIKAPVWAAHLTDDDEWIVRTALANVAGDLERVAGYQPPVDTDEPIAKARPGMIAAALVESARRYRETLARIELADEPDDDGSEPDEEFAEPTTTPRTDEGKRLLATYAPGTRLAFEFAADPEHPQGLTGIAIVVGVAETTMDAGDAESGPYLQDWVTLVLDAEGETFHCHPDDGATVLRPAETPIYTNVISAYGSEGRRSSGKVHAVKEGESTKRNIGYSATALCGRTVRHGANPTRFDLDAANSCKACVRVLNPETIID